MNRTTSGRVVQRFLSALGIAALLAVNVTQGATAGTTFAAWHSIYDGEIQAISFQANFLDGSRDGDDLEQAARMQARVEEAIARVEKIGYGSCYANYALTALSLIHI